MKVYEGVRSHGDDTDKQITVDGKPLEHIAYHSPAGMDWGHGGSGSADLALSILSDFDRDVRVAYRFHQQFKTDFVAKFAHWEWRLEGDDIRTWLDGFEI